MLVRELLSVVEVEEYAFVKNGQYELITDYESASFAKIKRYLNLEISKVMPLNNLLEIYVKSEVK